MPAETPAGSEFHQPYRLGTQLVSGVWPFLLPEEFRYFRVPEERHASCLSCPKVVTDGFDPIIRCCSYHPRIPNFLLGLALQNKATRPAIQQMMADWDSTPEGMQQSPGQTLASLQEHASDQFGKNQKVVCRFLDQKTKYCGIYPYRNSVCSTFFCISDGDRAGEEFWDRLQGIVGQMEAIVSQWAMDEMGLRVADYFERYNGLARKLDDCTDPKTGGWSEWALKELWQDWWGRQEEFFQGCAKLLWQHRNELYSIACERKIYQPSEFDRALGDNLNPELKREYELEGKAGGTPMSPQDLWYLVEKAERDLWLWPDPQAKWVLSDQAQLLPTDRKDPLDALYLSYPHKVLLGQTPYYFKAAEWPVILSFEQPRTIKPQDADMFPKLDFCQLVGILRHAGVIVGCDLQ